MREFARIPNYLTQGLIENEKKSDDDERTAQEVEPTVWERVEVAGIPLLVRTAKRRAYRVRRTSHIRR